VKSRVATALRMAVQSLWNNQSAPGDFYRRKRARLGTPKAATATAHKLARIIHHQYTTRTPYNESDFAKNEERNEERKVQSLFKQAAAMGYNLTLTETVT
jgi:transposase